MNQSINTDSKNSKEPQQKHRLGTVSIKILGGLNRFTGSQHHQGAYQDWNYFIGFNSHFSSWSMSRNTFPNKLSDHDVVSGTLKVYIPPKKKPRRKVCLYHKGDFESRRKDATGFAKDRYFNGYSDNRSVLENFDLITSIFFSLSRVCW